MVWWFSRGDSVRAGGDLKGTGWTSVDSGTPGQVTGTGSSFFHGDTVDASFRGRGLAGDTHLKGVPTSLVKGDSSLFGTHKAGKASSSGSFTGVGSASGGSDFGSTLAGGAMLTVGIVAGIWFGFDLVGFWLWRPFYVGSLSLFDQGKVGDTIALAGVGCASGLLGAYGAVRWLVARGVLRAIVAVALLVGGVWLYVFVAPAHYAHIKAVTAAEVARQTELTRLARISEWAPVAHATVSLKCTIGDRRVNCAKGFRKAHADSLNLDLMDLQFTVTIPVKVAEARGLGFTCYPKSDPGDADPDPIPGNRQYGAHELLQSSFTGDKNDRTFYCDVIEAAPPGPNPWPGGLVRRYTKVF